MQDVKPRSLGQYVVILVVVLYAVVLLVGPIVAMVKKAL
jgi:hypothetical protein